jgi:tRNA/rRNA methyltransferase
MKIKFILNSPRNPKNIGAAARGMANFGFRRLIVVNPYQVAWRETRSAVNASAVVEKAKKITSLKKAIRGIHLVIGTSAGSRRKESARWIGLEQFKNLIQANDAANKSSAVIFGSERSGLSNDDLALCHYVLKIPTVAECPSMNLSQAVAVVACAIREENKSAAPSAPPAHVSTEHLERLVSRGLQAFTAAGLLKGWDDARSERRIRQALYRWNLTDVDVAMLHGIFGWVLKKVK